MLILYSCPQEEEAYDLLLPKKNILTPTQPTFTQPQPTK